MSELSKRSKSKDKISSSSKRSKSKDKTSSSSKRSKSKDKTSSSSKYSINSIKIKLDNNHEIDEHALPLLDKEIFNFIFNNKPLYFSHLTENYKKSEAPLNRILKENAPELKYERRRFDFKKTIHWGQMKLHLSEIEFLNLVYQEYKKIETNKLLYFIYAGAAPGHHIKFLHNMFPDIKFELYDPNPFKISNNEYINIHTGELDGYFTNENARYWKQENHPDKYIVFCSDIRTEPATPENVKQNMDMQLNWWKIMNPELSMFKFRLPWTDENSDEKDYTEYPKGNIYIQVYPGHTSTETRLVIKKNAPIIRYNNAKYENQLFYHNKISRNLYYDNILGELNIQRDGICNCYDCVSLINIIKQYLEIVHDQKNIDKKELYKLIIDNIKFINGRYSVLTKTIDNFNHVINVVLSNIYIKCNKKKCNVCRPDEYKFQTMVSKAQHVKTISIVDN